MMPVEPRNAEAHDLGPLAVATLTEKASGAPVDAAAGLGRRPPSHASKSALMDWAFGEYYRLAEQGEPPDLRAYCARFPTCCSALFRTLDVASFIGDHPEFLADRPRADKPVAWPSEGERRGDWTMVRELGRGGFARVFLAIEASTGDRPVAVKFSLLGGEARTLGRLSHAHVVPILSARSEESTGLSMVCMPYLGSATLEDVRDHLAVNPEQTRTRGAALFLDVLRACAQPEDPPAAPAHPRLQKGSFTDGVVHLAIQLAEALAFVHAQGVYHCDLKPSNVLLDPSGKPMLLDFNLSALEREPVPVGGTFGYMAPEQLRAYLKIDDPKLDGRTDLYALAAMVWELLAGEHPFGSLPPGLNGPPLAQLLLQRGANALPSLKRLCPDLERPVADVLQRCLSADPADRPSSAAELAAELKRQFAPARRLRRWLTARPRLTLTALGLFTLAAAAAGYTWAVTPPYGEREYEAGKADYRAGRYVEAEQHFENCLSREPDNRLWRRARGWARLKASHSLPDDRAKDKMDQSLNDLMYGRGGKIDDEILELKAFLQARQQNAREALAIYAQLAASGRSSAALLNNRAYCRIHLSGGAEGAKLLEQAEADLEAAAALAPNSQAVYFNRARIALHKRTASRRSLDDIERAVQLGPPSPALYRDAALLYGQAADLRFTPVMLDAPLAAALFLEARPRRIARALYYARESIALGQSPRQFILFKNLVPRPTLSELLEMRPPPTTPAPEPRLIDPSNELD